MTQVNIQECLLEIGVLPLGSSQNLTKIRPDIFAGDLKNVLILVEIITKGSQFLTAHAEYLLRRDELEVVIQRMLNSVEELDVKLETIAEKTEISSNGEDLME